MNLKFENVVIVSVGETQFKGAKEYPVRELVVQSDPDEKYPQYHVINFNGDKAEDLDDFSEGEIVNVDVNVNGRSYTKDGETRYFNSLDGWKIKEVKGEKKAAAPKYDAPQDLSSAPDENDLPF